jgi:hypothetical protein
MLRKFWNYYAAEIALVGFIVGVFVLLFGLFVLVETSRDVQTDRGFGFDVHCLDGVEYYVGNKKMAVKYNTDGTVSTCEVQ